MEMCPAVTRLHARLASKPLKIDIAFHRSHDNSLKKVEKLLIMYIFFLVGCFTVVKSCMLSFKTGHIN